MGFLDGLFGGSGEDKPQFWNAIQNEEQFDTIVMLSMERPQVILKHSNQCATSYFAKKNLELIPIEELDAADLYIVDVIRQRSLSNYVAEKMQIRHESPQLFVIKNGEVVWHGSHHQVQADNITKWIK